MIKDHPLLGTVRTWFCRLTRRTASPTRQQSELPIAQRPGQIAANAACPQLAYAVVHCGIDRSAREAERVKDRKMLAATGARDASTAMLAQEVRIPLRRLGVPDALSDLSPCRSRCTVKTPNAAAHSSSIQLPPRTHCHWGGGGGGGWCGIVSWRIVARLHVSTRVPDVFWISICDRDAATVSSREDNRNP